MKMLSNALQTSRRAGGRKSCVDDEQDGDYGDVPAANHAPVLGVLDVAGLEFQVSIVVDGGALTNKVLRAVWLRTGPREETFNSLHLELLKDDLKDDSGKRVRGVARLQLAIHSTESTRGSTEWIHDPFHEVGRLVDYIIHLFHSKRSWSGWSGWSGFEAQAHKRSRIALATDQSMHTLENHASLSAADSSLYLSFFLAFSLSFRTLAAVAQQ
jgi:hypothetical protein